MFPLRRVREQWVAVAIVQIAIGQVVASGFLRHRVRLSFAHRIGSRCSLHTARDLGFTGASDDTRCYRLLPVVTSLWDDEDVEPAGHYKSKDTPKQ
jgi:hypothetical protein